MRGLALSLTTFDPVQEVAVVHLSPMAFSGSPEEEFRDETRDGLLYWSIGGPLFQVTLEEAGPLSEFLLCS